MLDRPERLPTAILRATALSLLLMTVAPQVFALKGDDEQPLYLEADNADLDDAKSTSVYTGNVFVQQGTLQIHADKVTIHHGKDHKPETILAVGNPATYRQEMDGNEKEVRAQAQRMEYVTKTNEITLIDKAVVYQGDDTFRNDRIVYDRTNARVKAGSNVQGKERVKILIHPADR